MDRNVDVLFATLMKKDAASTSISQTDADKVAQLSHELRQATQRIEQLEKSEADARNELLATKVAHAVGDAIDQYYQSKKEKSQRETEARRAFSAMRVGLFHFARIASRIPADVGRAMPKCRSTQHELNRKFEAGLDKCGLSLTHLEDPCHESKFMVAFHGTPCPTEVLCKGFDPQKRGSNGQAYGAGEYFAEDWQTAVAYARKNAVGGCSAVIVTLVVASKATKVANSWYVVNNPTDNAATFCLPLMALGTDSQTPLRLSTCLECFPVVFQFIDDHGKWADMTAAMSKVLAYAYRGALSFSTTSGAWTYEYNFGSMTQTNRTTGKVRRVRMKP